MKQPAEMALRLTSQLICSAGETWSEAGLTAAGAALVAAAGELLACHPRPLHKWNCMEYLKARPLPLLRAADR